MTHNEDRTHWLKEGGIGLAVGVLYGVTNVVTGHPFDTIKTKMQAQHGFEKSNMFNAFVKIVRKEGMVGLYRGCVPPLWGSGIYRSAQFAVFEAAYTYFDGPTMKSEIPMTGGVQLRVIAGGVIASVVRATIECPLEYAKIRRQTGQTWTFNKLYTGYGVTCSRTIGLMTTYFILIDSGRRHMSEQFKQPILGPFLASGIAATLAWWIIWPLEYMKSQIQSNYGAKNESVLLRMKKIVSGSGGFFGLYRGLAPGSIRSFVANGSAMIVMSCAQKKVTEWGLRD
ncbi:Mitochondrial substrate carrier family protein L [Nymphon striatum]|nr:Mitochondrial substrate carrier family protein L [Nymphon striatum]